MTSALPTAEESAPAKVAGSPDESTARDLGVALRWLAWVIGLALLWYVLGFASHLLRPTSPGRRWAAGSPCRSTPSGTGGCSSARSWRPRRGVDRPAASRVVPAVVQPVVADIGSSFGRWLAIGVLFALAVVIATVGKVAWLLLTAVTAVVLPLIVTVLTYLSQLIRLGIAGNVAERLLAPIGDLIPAVLKTASTWWLPLAVLLGGVVGMIARQLRRGRRTDMPVLAPATSVTTGDPGGRTPR